MRNLKLLLVYSHNLLCICPLANSYRDISIRIIAVVAYRDLKIAGHLPRVATFYTQKNQDHLQKLLSFHLKFPSPAPATCNKLPAYFDVCSTTGAWIICSQTWKLIWYADPSHSGLYLSPVSQLPSSSTIRLQHVLHMPAQYYGNRPNVTFHSTARHLPWKMWPSKQSSILHSAHEQEV